MTDPTITLYTNFCSSTKRTQGTIYHFMSTFSLCQWNDSEVWRTWQSNVALLRESWPRIEKTPDRCYSSTFQSPQTIHIHLSEALFLLPGFVKSREIIVLVVLQVVFGDGTPSVIRTIKYFPLVVNQALINWAVAEQADFHNRLSWLSDTDNLRLCPVNPGHPKKQRQSRLSLKDLVNLLSISQT